jgi:hypothetical protein
MDLEAELKEAFQEALDGCLKRGMQLPFIVCAVSLNGSVICMRANGMSADTDLLAEHYEGLGFLLPVNIMVIDKTGEAARIVFAIEGIVFH